METQKRIAVFLGEFDLQVAEVGKIFDRLTKILARFDGKDTSSEMVESAGYWLHNLYCAFEDLFKVVGGFWENDVQSDGRYHIQLLKRMMIHIEGIRPALISDESYRYLNELRGFRHIFRHAYSYGLDDERVSFLIRSSLDKKKMLFRDFQKFRDDITQVE